LQAKVGDSRTGPAIIVMGQGFYAARSDAASYSALPMDGSPSYGLSIAQVNDLIARLAVIDLASLPHASTSATDCSAKLFVRTCASCPSETLTYAAADQLVPEFESVWAWFDEVLGSPTSVTNPRTYCRQ